MEDINLNWIEEFMGNWNQNQFLDLDQRDQHQTCDYFNASPQETEMIGNTITWSDLEPNMSNQISFPLANDLNQEQIQTHMDKDMQDFTLINEINISYEPIFNFF